MSLNKKLILRTIGSLPKETIREIVNKRMVHLFELPTIYGKPTDHDKKRPKIAVIGPQGTLSEKEAIRRKEMHEYGSNTTRFAVISKNDEPAKTLIIVYPRSNQPGVLDRILEIFLTKNIHLTRFVSRPKGLDLGEYIYFVEFEGKQSEIKETIENILSLDIVMSVRSIGSYPIAKKIQLKLETLLFKYDELINRKDITEKEVQTFLQENPMILDFKAVDVHPQYSLGGELKVDFMIESKAVYGRKYIIVEIKKPTDKLYTRKGDQTAILTHARQQVEDTLRWINENKEFLNRRLSDISSTSGIVIIGRNRTLNSEDRKRLIQTNKNIQAYQIKTYDEILEENKALIENIKKLIT